MKNLIKQIEQMENQSEALRTVKVVVDHLIEVTEATLDVLKTCQKIANEVDEHKPV